MSIPQSAGGPDRLARRSGALPRQRAPSRASNGASAPSTRNSSTTCSTHKPVPYEGPSGIRALLEGMRRFGWEPVMEGEHIIGADAERRLDQPGAGRAVRAFGRGAAHGARDLRRSEHPSGAGARGGRRDWCRRARPRLRAELAPRRSADDAQGPLRHHAQLHAEGRRLWAGDDVPHLHGAGESRFRVRSRHGEEIPRRPGAAAGGDRAVRQFAVPRRQAERISLIPRHIWTDVDNARAGMLPWVFEDGMWLRALCRLRARCADVFRLSRRQIYRRGGQELPRFSRRHAFPK